MNFYEESPQKGKPTGLGYWLKSKTYTVYVPKASAETNSISTIVITSQCNWLLVNKRFKIHQHVLVNM